MIIDLICRVVKSNQSSINQRIISPPPAANGTNSAANRGVRAGSTNDGAQHIRRQVIRDVRNARRSSEHVLQVLWCAREQVSQAGQQCVSHTRLRKNGVARRFAANEDGRWRLGTCTVQSTRSPAVRIF